MKDLIIKILEDTAKYPLVYILLAITAVYVLIFGRGVVALVLFTFAIGILVGQVSHK